ncbi:MATE efflux family protein [Pseudopedobacter saltans DSM 12145]|uniref:Multidrug-efflux transporter n=1 Tax=Pseudopedobacter saltans (strain ATCC 51119 / DSM 12145 / JCM 21818 / CCUG 39354 / LMG 10337 / NBRC 100064 / NCIMB 13643) TaxID=762903 RepID=F0SDR2_PSESL|nr:MATE family efflux transporter [Pseudopedobacter saltans]ADY50789.1 MATE efflux family protein [Pseudopedobacter saltans DSM 12145]
MSNVFSTYKQHYKDNLVLAIPIVISQLGHTMVQTADSIIVGHFAGTISLAASSLVHSIFMVIMVIGIGISYGLTPLIAQENGRGNKEECGKLLSNSLYLNILTGILLFSVVYLGSVFLINHLKQDAAVIVEAKPYLNVLGFSIIPLMVFLTFKQFAEGLGFTKQAMMVSIWGNVLNIILGITFVKGLFGVKPMGLIGVGYSTLIDRSLMAIVMAVYVFKSKYFRDYLRQFTFRLIDKVRMSKIFKIGLPTALQYTFEVSAFSAAAILTGTIGAVEQASHQVAINLAAMTYMMASGIASAAGIKSGNNFGKRDFFNLRKSAIASYHIAIVFMCVAALSFVVFNGFLPKLFTDDISVINIASGLLLIAALFQLFDGTQVIGLGVLRGMGDVNIPTLITFTSYWIFGLPVGYLLGIVWGIGVNGIWLGLTLGLLVASLLLFIRFNLLTKKYNKTLVSLADA